MAAKGASVNVTGLKELRKAVKEAGDELPKEMRQTNKNVAERIIEPAAKERGRQSRRNLAGGRAALGSVGVASIRTLATQKSATIAMGGGRVPWAGGSEWGSGGAYRQFPPKNPEGYILYPTVKDKRDEVIEAYLEEMERFTGRIFR